MALGGSASGTPERRLAALRTQAGADEQPELSLDFLFRASAPRDDFSTWAFEVIPLRHDPIPLSSTHGYDLWPTWENARKNIDILIVSVPRCIGRIRPRRSIGVPSVEGPEATLRPKDMSTQVRGADARAEQGHSREKDGGASSSSARSAFRGYLSSGDWWLCAGAVCANILYVVVLNNTVYPSFNDVFLQARDISSLASIVVLVLLYLLSTRKPGSLDAKLFVAAAIACCCVGTALEYLAIFIAHPVLLAVSTSINAAGTAWISTMTMLALVDLADKQGIAAVFGAIVAGWTFCYLGELLLLPASAQVKWVLFAVLLLARAAFSWRGSTRVLNHPASPDPIVELRITNPRSFVPSGHALFVTLILLKMSFGFAMTFASSDAMPLVTVAAGAPVLLTLVALGLFRKTDLDSVYRASLLFVLAGFLLVNPLIESLTGMPALANVILRAGSDLSRVLAFLLVATIGARNITGAPSVAIYVGVANTFGSLLGAQLGIAANAALAADPGLLALLLAVIIFAFVAYNLLSPDVFRLDEAANAVEAVPSELQAAQIDAPTLEQACEHVCREHGLTPRESEVLELLARGRNAQAIQDRLTISRGTAKTHIRNVYAKLGIHSQQELIELVEQEEAGEPEAEAPEAGV